MALTRTGLVVAALERTSGTHSRFSRTSTIFETTMKDSLPTIVVTAFTSSILTALAFQLLQTDRSGDRVAAGPPYRGTSTATREDALDPELRTSASAARSPATSAIVATSSLGDLRFEELERRLKQLESDPRRQPVGTSPDSNLVWTGEFESIREQVLDWVAEDREARRIDEEAEERARLEKELRFDADYEALMFAQDHELPDWRREQLGDLFFEIELKQHDYEASIDPLVDDPAQVEAGWVEFEQWSDQLLLDALGEELHAKLMEHWDGEHWDGEDWDEEDWDEEDWEGEGG